MTQTWQKCDRCGIIRSAYEAQCQICTQPKRTEMQTHLNESEMETFILTAVEEDLGEMFATVASFADVGMLTDDLGFVISFADGAEFQVTVVQTAGFSEEDQ